MLLLVSLVGALAVAGMAFGAKPPPKPKKPNPGHPASPQAFSWHDTPTGSTASLRGLSAVSANVVWASGATATPFGPIAKARGWSLPECFVGSRRSWITYSSGS